MFLQVKVRVLSDKAIVQGRGSNEITIRKMLYAERKGVTDKVSKCLSEYSQVCNLGMINVRADIQGAR